MPLVNSSKSLVAVMPTMDDASTSSGECYSDRGVGSCRGSGVIAVRTSRFSKMGDRMCRMSDVFSNSTAGALLRGASMQVAQNVGRLNKMESTRLPPGVGGAALARSNSGTFDPFVVSNDVKSLLKAASTMIQDVITKKKMSVFLTLATICWVSFSNTIFTVLVKIVRSPSREESPQVLYVCALVQLCTMVLYFIMILLHPERARLLGELVKLKPHVACLVPSLFYMFMYMLSCLTIESLSSTLFACLTTGRQFVFAVLEYVCFGTKIGLVETMLLTTLLLSAISHATTYKVDPEVTPNLGMGCIQAMCYCVVSGIAIIYFSWAVPKFKLDTLVSGFINGFQVASYAILYEMLKMYVATGQPWGIEKGFQWDNGADIGLLISWVSTDMSYFFCPLWLSGMHLGIAQALCIPCMFFFEFFYYILPVNVPQIMTVSTLFVLLADIITLKEQ